MSKLSIETRLQAIKEIASNSCTDTKDADNICSFCDEIADMIPNTDKVVKQLEELKEELEKSVNLDKHKNILCNKYYYNCMVCPASIRDSYNNKFCCGFDLTKKAIENVKG